MLGKMLIYNLISYNIVCNTNTTTNANEIKALTRVESEKHSLYDDTFFKYSESAEGVNQKLIYYIGKKNPQNSEQNSQETY